MMRTYKDFRPTQFDGHITVEGQEDWLVAPVSQTRDSGCLDRANFDACRVWLKGEGLEYVVQRFGHWGPGWYELILVAPTDKAIATLERIEANLADYPVLSEELLSEYECDEAFRTWQYLSLDERREIVDKYTRGLTARQRAALARRKAPPLGEFCETPRELIGE